MADPEDSDTIDLEYAANKAAELLKARLGSFQSGGVMQPENNMGMLFLALLNNPDPQLKEGAEGAYQTWYNEAERTLMRENNLPPGERPEASEVHEAMTKRLREELLVLGGLDKDDDLSSGAETKIKALMEGGPAAFSAAILENEELVKEAQAAYELKLEEYKKAQAEGKTDVEKPTVDTVGILAVLIQENADKQVPKLDKVSTKGIDVSPEGQRETTLSGAFEAIHGFMNTQGSGEDYLVMLAGEKLGAQDAPGGKREGISRITGLGGLNRNELERQLAAFTSDEGLATLDPRNAEYYSNFSLMDGGRAGAANMDNLMTQPMVERGLVSFDTPEARQAWNMELAGGLAAKLSAEDLQARMVDFAMARDDVDLSTEMDEQARIDRELRSDQVKTVNMILGRPVGGLRDLAVDLDKAGQEDMAETIQAVGAELLAEHEKLLADIASGAVKAGPELEQRMAEMAAEMGPKFDALQTTLEGMGATDAASKVAELKADTLSATESVVRHVRAPEEPADDAGVRPVAAEVEADDAAPVVEEASYVPEEAAAQPVDYEMALAYPMTDTIENFEAVEADPQRNADMPYVQPVGTEMRAEGIIVSAEVSQPSEPAANAEYSLSA